MQRASTARGALRSFEIVRYDNKVQPVVTHYRGTPANPLSEKEIGRKAEILARSVLSPEKIKRFIESFPSIEEVRDLGVVLRLIQV